MSQLPQNVLEMLQADREAAINRLCDWVAIPSISTDPAYQDDCRRAAHWAAEQLQPFGFDCAILHTGGHPAVVGEYQCDRPEAPTILFYGHYDVQPADPIEQWHTPPFQPTVRNGRIYGRGVSDNKGLILCFIDALRIWHSIQGRLPIHIKVLLEGEEECGSENLPGFIARHKALLDADIAVITDTNMWGMHPPRPAITCGLRGLMYFDVKLIGPNSDLHSGMYGGVAPNPATLLTGVLGQLFDADQRITIDGFYDQVLPPSQTELDSWAQLRFDADQLASDIGVDALPGESGFTPLQRLWTRPSCDINGLYGGFQGNGAKTVIPASAGAKISFRLVPDQDPQLLAERFIQWLNARTPSGCRWQITPHGTADPIVLDPDSPWFDAARRALAIGFGTEPVLIRDGATIPVVACFKKTLGIDSLMLGLRHDDDNLHAPNEKLNLECLFNGTGACYALLDELSQMTCEA